MNVLGYRCPLCQLPLKANPHGLACDNKHQFDRAKEGYFNLLPVQHKHSKVPGDSVEMVNARRNFLAQGHYQPLQQALIEQLSLVTAKAQILDLGCGEGYYTNAVSNQLNDSQVWGLDIAKAAIRYAAKRSQKANFSVASSAKLPFADNFADIIYKVFAPINLDELKRVLKPEGTFISVVPGPKHLLELKQLIYSDPKYHKPEALPNGFELIRQQQLSQQITLTKPQHIADLATMTPFTWKLKEEKKQQLINGGTFKISLDFTINIYQTGS